MNFSTNSKKSLVSNKCSEMYFNASARCLLKKNTVISLPDQIELLMRKYQASSLDLVHFQLMWRELLKKYDMPKNAELENYDPDIHNLGIMRPIRRKSKILDEEAFSGDKPCLLKIIQFYYDDIPCCFAYNPAVVTYYYGNTLLCSFDMYYELCQSLGEIEHYANDYDANDYEFSQLMNACIMGESIYSNPCDICDENGNPMDYLEYLRMEASGFDPRWEEYYRMLEEKGKSSADNELITDDDEDALPF